MLLSFKVDRTQKPLQLIKIFCPRGGSGSYVTGQDPEGRKVTGPSGSESAALRINQCSECIWFLWRSVSGPYSSFTDCSLTQFFLITVPHYWKKVNLPPIKSTCDQSSVADPDAGSGAFLSLDPGLGISFFWIPDPIHISNSLLKIFWVKNTSILCQLTQIFLYTCSKHLIIFNFVKFKATPFFAGTGIRDGKKIRIRDNIPDPQHWSKARKCVYIRRSFWYQFDTVKMVKRIPRIWTWVLIPMTN